MGVRRTKLGMTVQKPRTPHWMGLSGEEGGKVQKKLEEQGDERLRAYESEARKTQGRLPKVAPNPITEKRDRRGRA